MSLAVVTDAAALKEKTQRWRQSGLKIGFVPTMGALHEGHLSLVRIALQNADLVVASVFVNPAQFAPHEDFAAYPRAAESDLAKLEKEGAHLAYLPGETDIYPRGILPHPPSPQAPSPLREREGARASGKGEGVILPAECGLESDFRPHFFRGVKTVVGILFEQVKPAIAVFGEKDFQQLQVIREMAQARALPVEIIGGPTIRDEHGLALSSRNAYLSPAELAAARRLNKILFETAEILRHCKEPDHMNVVQATRQSQDCFAGARNDALDNAKSRLLAAGFDKIDYLETRWGRLLAAAWLGKTRLIDNVAILQ